MARIIKGRQMTARYYKGREALKEYKQGRLVYEKSTAIPDYLCFTALEAGQFTLTIPAAVTATYLSYIEWSKDGRTWNHRDNSSDIETIDVQVAQGDKVYWRGSGNATAMGTTVGTQNSQFSSTGNFDVSGNIMSLLFTNNFEEQTSLPNVRYSFTALFRNCSKLISAENLLLPATKLQMECYRNLFLSCSNLVKGIKVLPAMQLMQNCYLQMYGNCSSLTEGTEIPATTAVSQCCYGMYTGCSSLTIPKPILFTNTASYCCYQMYRFCTSLEVAPDLTQATLADNCCRQMFKGCTKLKYIKCLATNISATQCLLDWCDGVSSTGTFIQASGVTWPRGASGIPTGWVDVEKRTMPSGYKQVEYLQAVKPYPTNYNAAIVGTEIVLDPSQDTIEFAVWPRLDEDGYLINGGGSTAGEMPFANTSSPTTTTAKVGLFYILYRVNSSTNLLSAFFTRVNGDGTNRASGFSLDAINKVTDNPQTIRVECSATSSVMYLNGTQVASRSGYTVDTSDMTTLQAFVLAYNNKIYSWEHPFYYLKWWRGANLIADYVPCVRESDDEVGFYDFVSQTFKTRYYTSSEPFTAGEEI